MKRTEKAIITKIEANGNEIKYGENFINEVIPKNYRYNGMFWEAPNTKTIYLTEQR